MHNKEFSIEELANGTKIFLSPTHRFGTDAMLLSHFCNIHKYENGCDIGSGCGIIPLRWYDNGHRGNAYSIEIHPEGKQLLELSIQENKINNIVPINQDIKQFSCDILFDVVSCNPPYFKNVIINKNKDKAIQRHQISLTTKDLCICASKLLKDKGRLCICQRPDFLAEVIHEMMNNNIMPKQLRFVRQAPETKPWLVLIDGRKYGGTGLTVLPDLIVGDGNGGFSKELLKIYGKI